MIFYPVSKIKIDYFCSPGGRITITPGFRRFVKFYSYFFAIIVASQAKSVRFFVLGGMGKWRI
jgi:hypothetical protein